MELHLIFNYLVSSDLIQILTCYSFFLIIESYFYLLILSFIILAEF